MTQRKEITSHASEIVALLSEENKKHLTMIKQSVWHRMDGVTAAFLREQESTYRFTLGLTITHLREIASAYPKCLSLSRALLAHQMRELKLIGLMLFPPEALDKETIKELLTGANTSELRNHLAFHILSEAPDFDSLIQSLSFSGDSASMEVACVATSRCLIRNQRIQEETITHLLQAMEEFPLSSYCQNLLLHLGEKSEYHQLLRSYLVQWLALQDDNKKYLAQELLLLIGSSAFATKQEILE